MEATPIEYRLAVRMLFGKHDHINELKEEAPLRHLEHSAPDAELIVPPGAYTFTLPADDQPRSQPRVISGTAAASPFGLLALSSDRATNHKSKSSPLNGYWLPVKGEAADASRESYAKP